MATVLALPIDLFCAELRISRNVKAQDLDHTMYSIHYYFFYA
jgi:hypothetical protein